MRRLRNAVIIGLLWSASLQAQPKLVMVAGDTYDWGVVTDVATPLKSKIELKNVGTQEVVIDEVRPACGCTLAPLEKSRLQPGESTFMNITLNLTGSNGPLLKNVYINSNSIPFSSQTLILKAFVQRPIQSDPLYVALPPLVVGKTVTATVKFKNTVKVPVTITENTSNEKTMTTNLKKTFTIQPGDSLETTVKVTPTKDKIGYYHAMQFFKTNHADQRQFELNIYGNVQDNTVADASGKTSVTPSKANKSSKKRKSSDPSSSSNASGK